LEDALLSNRKLPDYRLKQKILYLDETSPDDLIRYGNLFYEAGSYSDALDFFQKSNHTEGIESIKKIALESGDVMLFQRAAKSMNMELSPLEWGKIGKKAMELKKYFFARHALEKADNQDILNSLENIMKAEEQKISS
jgi:tetratricopeptide (TPR) repeat protein